MTAAVTVWRAGALACLRAPTAFLRHPFLAPGPRRTPICYRGWEKGRPFYLHVGAEDSDISLATQADGDILVYVVTRLMVSGDTTNCPPGVMRIWPLDERGGRDDEERGSGSGADGRSAEGRDEDAG